MENQTTRKIRNLCKYIHKRLLPELSEDFHIDYSDLLRERDTSDIWRQFAIWFLVDPEHGVIRLTRRGSKQRETVKQVAQLYIEDCKDGRRWKDTFVAAETAICRSWFTEIDPRDPTRHPDSNASRNADSTACRAAFNAVAVWYDWGSAAEAVHNNATAYAVAAADSYATSYAWSAYYAAATNAAASEAAYYTAYAAAFAAADANTAGVFVHYKLMADKLIELLQAAPMMKETV